MTVPVTTIEELEKIFSEHATKYEQQKEESLRHFQENNPGVTLPDYLQDAFNLPMALATICKELVRLKAQR